MERHKCGRGLHMGRKRTLRIRINPRKPERGSIRRAARIIMDGGIVGFPTETVYGLGANALDAKAVGKIFTAKDRPFDDPLIVHVCRMGQVYGLVKKVTLDAKVLMEKFWPGALTIILEKSPLVPQVTTAGLSSVAIRMPSHKIARMLIEEAKVPIAAPSANTFGKPSPTNAQHVLDDLDGKIDCVIDGGDASIGVESTVIDMTGTVPVVLRPGGISVEEISKAIGKVRVHHAVGKNAGKRNAEKLKKFTAKSPGMKYRHYAPRAEVILVEGRPARVMEKIGKLVKENRSKKIGLLLADSEKNAIPGLELMHGDVMVEYLGGGAQNAAKNLFRSLRKFDTEKVGLVIAQGIAEKGMGLAVMNRLRRAAGRVVRV